MNILNFKINNQEFQVEEGKTILEVASQNNINIPNLCHHPDIEKEGGCGLCLVEIKGWEELQLACKVKVQEGMEIITDSEDLLEKRKERMKQIMENHVLACIDCVWMGRCRLLQLGRELGVQPVNQNKESNKVWQSASIVFDQTKCIGCGNCVSVCPVKHLSLDENNKLKPSDEASQDCINCGQCILHCPVGAIEGVGEFEELEKVEQILADESKIVVVQFAPAIRVNIGDEFGMPVGSVATEKMVAGLKQLGFDYVFDTACAADFTTMEESDELIERLTKNENLPAMTSCCPAWVKFVEFYYPQFIPNICTSRSPQIMMGGIIKNYWASKMNIKPENVYVISIMPCVAKKVESCRKELEIDGLPPVDLVLTTRELARLFKKKQINLATIKGVEADNPFGTYSGAGVIYGASGGVFESALRTAYFKMTGEELGLDAVTEIRGIEGKKVKEIQVGGKTLKVCVVNGIINAREVLEELKQNPRLYDAVEVMACSGGCVGGGGQCVPMNKQIIKARAKSLYQLDETKELKYAHRNPEVLKVYEEFFNNHETRKKVLHTHFAPRQKTELKELRNAKETEEIG